MDELSVSYGFCPIDRIWDRLFGSDLERGNSKKEVLR